MYSPTIGQLLYTIRTVFKVPGKIVGAARVINSGVTSYVTTLPRNVPFINKGAVTCAFSGIVLYVTRGSRKNPF